MKFKVGDIVRQYKYPNKEAYLKWGKVKAVEPVYQWSDGDRGPMYSVTYDSNTIPTIWKEDSLEGEGQRLTHLILKRDGNGKGEFRFKWRPASELPREDLNVQKVDYLVDPFPTILCQDVDGQLRFLLCQPDRGWKALFDEFEIKWWTYIEEPK